MQTVAHNNFITVKTESGILPAELLQRIADDEVEDLNHQLRLEPAREDAAIWSPRLMQSRVLLLRPVFCQAREW